MDTNYPYRGYCREQKKWVLGFLYDATPMYCFREDYEMLGRNLCILVPGFADWGMPRPVEQYPVVADSVGMYTGLTVHCNGEDIPIYTGMQLGVREANGCLQKLTVTGPVNGCFVCSGDGAPDTPLSSLLQIQDVFDVQYEQTAERAFKEQMDLLIAKQKASAKETRMHVNPTVFAQYLKDAGWTEYRTKRDCVKVFQREAGGELFQVTIPMRKTLVDYDEAMQRAIDTVVQAEVKAKKEQR